MPHSLVTGGAGFIGSHLVDELLKAGHKVTVIDDLSGGNTANVPKGATFIQGNTGDDILISQLFCRERFDIIFHLAAYAAEGLSHFIRGFNYRNNILGAIPLINAAINHEVGCFVFTSSVAVYGAGGSFPLREDMVPVPIDPYGVSKLAVEQDLLAAHKSFGLNYIIFRPHNVFGERQNIGDHYRNVVGIFMNQILQGKPMTIFGDGEQRRAFTHIGNVAPIIARSICFPEMFNETYNLGTDRHLSVNELATKVAEAMGVSRRVIHYSARHEARFAYCSHEKLSSVIPNETVVSLEDGLRRMAGWVKEHGPSQGPAFEKLEVVKRFPEAWAHLISRLPREG